METQELLDKKNCDFLPKSEAEKFLANLIQRFESRNIKYFGDRISD